MGYTTSFWGEVSIDPPLNPAEISFLEDFAGSRRMKRSNGPLYVQGGQDTGAPDIEDVNKPDPDQPSLNCDWVPSSDGHTIEWGECEKFYEAELWMKYIVENLLAPSAAAYIAEHKGEDSRLALFTCAHTVSGTIDAQGEEPADRWRIVVRDNKVFVQKGEMVFSDEEAV